MAKPTKETEEEPRGDLPPRPPDEVAPPDPNARKAFESREDYRGFKMPRGMSLPQRRAWKKSIDEREGFAAKTSRELPRASEFLRETVGGLKKSTKEMGKEAFKEVEGLRELGATVGPAVKEVAEDIVLAKPRAKAYLYSEPEKAKEFGRAVLSGDRPAIRKLSEEASKSAIEPFATGGEAILGGLAAEEGKYGEATMYGGMLLLPGVLSKLGPKMSKGWLKSAAEAGEEIPDEAAKKMNDLAKRVEAGEVTDDMQIRREIAMIEDAHALDYAKSRPVEDPMQQGRSRPRADVDPEGAREFDREPPGYMGMSRPNQPMSRFSEGHARFIDELRTDMTEDTNFGELSSRFYNDLESIDKREDLLRSTGKDALGRQLDDVQITNEYEKLSKERQALANEYYVAKAEREAELRFEGSYVPPGSKTTLAGEPVGPPRGGGGSVKDQADEMQRELDSLSYAGQMESEGRIYMDEDLGEHFANRYSDEVHAEVARRIKAGDKYGAETFYEMADPDDYLPSGGGTPRGTPGGGADLPPGMERIDPPEGITGTEDFEYFRDETGKVYSRPVDFESNRKFLADIAEIEKKLGELDDRYLENYNERQTLSGAELRANIAEQDELRTQKMKLRRQLEELAPNRKKQFTYGTSEAAQRAKMANRGLNPQGEPLTGVKKDLLDMLGADRRKAQREAFTTMSDREILENIDDLRNTFQGAYREPGNRADLALKKIDRIESLYAGDGFKEVLGGGGRVPEFTEDTGIDQYKELVMSFADEGRPFSFTEVYKDPSQPFDLDLYKAVDELIAEGRISGPTTDLKLDRFGRVLNHDTMIYTKAPGGGGRSVDERLAAEGIPVRMPGRTGPRDPEFEMRREISTRDAFYDDQESGGKLFRIGDRYIEAADVDNAIRLASNDDGLEHYIRVPGLDAYDDDSVRRLITEASPEESAKYFEMKRVNPRGDESGFSQPRPVWHRKIIEFRQEVADLPDSRFKDVLLEDIDEVIDLPDDFFDQPGIGTREESLSNLMELYEMQKKQGFPAIKNPVADEDIPTPSFEALQQKLGRRSDPNEPKFGDPNELEMLKEAYRRAAGTKQQMDIARDRVRGSRSPTAQGAPASFPGPEPEGTSRAVRRSPRRERPKKKE